MSERQTEPRAGQTGRGMEGERADDRLELRLGRYTAAVEARLARWQAESFGRRLWDRDPTLWSAEPVPEISDRLGWLDLPFSMQAGLGELERLSAEARAEGIRDAVVLGMGGSSLAPEVFARTFGTAAGSPAVTVLDSTHPAAVRALAARLDLARTLFVVSSKSGTTTEMLSFFYFFWQRLAAALPPGSVPGRHFVAVTDPATPLENLARDRQMRALFTAPSDVGGRYSALTPFGLVPAALLGVGAGRLLVRGRAMAEACGAAVRAAANPALRLGAALGELTLAGRDKVTFLTTPGLASFPDWLEQLIAESTGKIGRGIVPVAGEAPGPPEVYGEDRFFVALVLEGDDEAGAAGGGHGSGAAAAGEGGVGALLSALAGAGHPVASIRLREPLDLASEMFRWEMAVAAASAVIGVHPFNQPDVQLAKELAGKAMKKKQAASGRTDSDTDADTGADPGTPAADPGALARALEGWLAGASPGAYLGLQAYLAPSAETGRALHGLQALLRDRTRCAATAGYGPRFLHSTGQLHKGGPASGRFLQIVDDPAEDLAVPETAYSFGSLIRAQAEGDRQALAQRGRSVMRLQLGGDVAGGLAALAAGIRRLPPRGGPGAPGSPAAPGGPASGGS
ncbi:MAG TPA: hypothetical protein VHR45_24545 [Thermoanaerobaculia bacterium]|nr:hypothetical protein [Thermoanaerobaculia bacterium]